MDTSQLHITIIYQWDWRYHRDTVYLLRAIPFFSDFAETLERLTISVTSLYCWKCRLFVRIYTFVTNLQFHWNCYLTNGGNRFVTTMYLPLARTFYSRIYTFSSQKSGRMIRNWNPNLTNVSCRNRNVPQIDNILNPFIYKLHSFEGRRFLKMVYIMTAIQCF